MNVGIINYDIGRICFGFVNIIGIGGNNFFFDLIDDDKDDLIDRIGIFKIFVEVIFGNIGIIGILEFDIVIEILILIVIVVFLGIILFFIILINSFNFF